MTNTRRLKRGVGGMMAVLVVSSLAGCGKPKPVVNTKPSASHRDPELTVLMAMESDPPRVKQEPPRDESDPLLFLDDAPWIPDGQNPARQVYVISAPWCGACKFLYKSTRDMVDKYQFRWIEVDPTDEREENLVALAATERTPEILDAIEEARKGMPVVPHELRANVLNYMDALGVKTKALVKDVTHSDEIGYPIVIWKEADGIHVKEGANNQMEVTLAGVVERPQAASIQPRGAAQVKMQFQREPLSGVIFSNDAAGAKGYCLPDDDSPVEFTMPPKEWYRPLSRVQINGQTWIEFVRWAGVTDRGYFVHEQELRTEKKGN